MKNKKPRSNREKVLLIAKTLAITIAILGTCYSILVLLGALFFSSLCGNTVIKTISSPDGKYDAIAFLRDCGATTGFTPEVSIIRHGRVLPNADGNIFRGSYGETFIDIAWTNNTTLIVQYTISDRGPIQLQEKKMADIQIQYQLIQP